MSWHETKGQLTVATVCLLTTFIAYSSQTSVLWNFLGGANTRTLLVLIPLNVFVILIYINYALVCLTDPGTVPDNWMPVTEAHMEVKRSTHEARFCKTCNNYKPARTHHCSTCGRCVLKMDHHCPWINNCVGYHNYGHFIRFITFTEISAIYLFVLLGCRLAQVIRDLNLHNVRPSMTETTFLSINLFLSFAAIVTVGILSGYHVYCLTTNTTTIEGWEKGTSLTIKSFGKIHDVPYPYNLGLYRNICAALGDQPLLWLWPQRMRGNGLYFPVRLDDEDTHNCTQEDMGEFATLVERPPRLHTRTSMHSNLHTPTTPASVLTFATSTTLVDHHPRLSIPVAGVKDQNFEMASR